MKKYLMIFLFLSNVVIAQEEVAGVLNEVPIITPPEKWSTCRSLMRNLSENDFMLIPESVTNLWYSKSITVVSEIGKEYSRPARFFKSTTRAIGEIKMRDDFKVILFCDFRDQGIQKMAVLGSFNSDRELLSVIFCYSNHLEMIVFLETANNEITIVTSGEESVRKKVVSLNEKGYFRIVNYEKDSDFVFD